MTMTTKIARADVVGSLLRPAYLKEARQGVREGRVSDKELRPEGRATAPLAGYSFLPAAAGWWSLWKEPDGSRADVWKATERPFVTRQISVVRNIVEGEYSFLRANARARTKLTIPAPSWHRIFWHPEHSRAAYPTPEDFLCAVATYLRTHVVEKLQALGGDYVQLDAPNYAQWHVDPDNRAAF